jgi:periplasmic protein TonB
MRALIQGTLSLEALVSADGSVVEARVTKSLDAKTGLDRQAIAAVQQWRFKPATRHGDNVPIVVNIEMSFRLK